MIFVVVGTQKFQMNRLLREIDKIAKNDLMNQDFFAQTGHSDYVPQNYKWEQFLTQDIFQKKVEECDVLITHGGVATIMAGIKAKKPIIVFPRLAEHGEHVDDHQLEIAESFFKANYVLLCKEKDDLEMLIQESRRHQFAEYISHRQDLFTAINEYIMGNM